MAKYQRLKLAESGIGGVLGSGCAGLCLETHSLCTIGRCCIGRRQDGKSRMSRDVHVRICERLGVRLPPGDSTGTLFSVSRGCAAGTRGAAEEICAVRFDASSGQNTLMEPRCSAFWRARRMGPKPTTFNFLGFTHLGTLSRRGKFTLHVKSMRKRLRRALRAVAVWCQEHRHGDHGDVAEQWRSLNAKLYGFYGRHRSLLRFYRGVLRLWHTG